MARRSRWEHLKDEIIQHCKEGKTPRELYLMYPDVAPKTIRDWYELIYPRVPPQSPQNSPDAKTIAPQDIQIIPSRKKLVALDGGEQLSDFALARKTLRAIAKNFNQPGAYVGVQAAAGLLKLVQIRAEIPKHILDETEVTGIEEERDRLKEVSLEELQQQYKDVANG
jgi:hypothetical protein